MLFFLCIIILLLQHVIIRPFYNTVVTQKRGKNTIVNTLKTIVSQTIFIYFFCKSLIYFPPLAFHLGSNYF